VLVWLSVWGEVQMILFSCHPTISCFIKIDDGFTFPLLAYPDFPGKDAVKWVSWVTGWASGV